MQAEKKARLEGWAATGSLGSGAYGEVVRIGTASGRCAALKIMSDGDDDLHCQDLVREVFGSSFCCVRNSVWVNSNRVGIFMDVAVSTLEYNHFQRSMPAPVVAHLLKPVVMELRALHRRNIMHRDIKPGNILVMPDMTCCLADFGLSLHRESSIDNAVVSLWYRSPELLLKRAHTSAADVWALGMLLVKCLSGWPLIQFMNEEDRLQAVLSLCLQIGSPDWDALHAAVPTTRHARRDGTLDWSKISAGPYSSLCANLVQQCLKILPDQRDTMETVAEHPFWNLELDAESKAYMQRFSAHLAAQGRPMGDSVEIFEDAFHNESVIALAPAMSLPPASGLPAQRMTALMQMLEVCHMFDLRWQVAAYAMWALDCCAITSNEAYLPAASIWTVSAFMEDVRVCPIPFPSLLRFFSAPDTALKTCVLKVITCTQGCWPDLTRMEALVMGGCTDQERFQLLASCVMSNTWTDLSLRQVHQVHDDVARLFAT